MLSQKYLHKIKQINPAKIYVENVRSLYGISAKEARLLCEMAVTGNLFERRIGLVCPADSCHGRIIAEFSSYDQIPPIVKCIICEAEGNETSEYETGELEIIEYYKRT